ncbi:small EDRK-rich factor 2-like isoform X1 [Heterodontus francisci]|uniref:small EDRK-rich factor 2-like isoform X1 n=1 Tax=Heterodontus francisci TaxID=7792 RepID=UPI00355BF9EC
MQRKLQLKFSYIADPEECYSLSGGNQRELARQKNAKKSTEQSKRKRKDDGLSAAARKQRDAEIMQQKQKATKNSAAPAGDNAGTSN